jgi:hypothetical protein
MNDSSSPMWFQKKDQRESESNHETAELKTGKIMPIICAVCYISFLNEFSLAVNTLQRINEFDL